MRWKQNVSSPGLNEDYDPTDLGIWTLGLQLVALFGGDLRSAALLKEIGHKRTLRV